MVVVNLSQMYLHINILFIEDQEIQIQEEVNFDFQHQDCTLPVEDGIMKVDDLVCYKFCFLKVTSHYYKNLLTLKYSILVAKTENTIDWGNRCSSQG